MRQNLDYSFYHLGQDTDAMIASNKTIMIIEDDNNIRDIMTDVFRNEGLEVIMALNGLDGIEKLKRMPVHHYPCCIILDLIMPIMNGEEFIFHIQALGRMELDSIPIVVSSGDPGLNSFKSDRVRFKFNKPINLEDLQDIASKYK